jgi:biotin transport system substrate-specific component
VSTAIAAPRPVLVDRLGATSVLTNVLYVLGGVALIAVAAQIQIPMFPVPMTGQTFAILLVGASFGLVRALITSVLYVGLAVAGLPILAAQVSTDGASFHTTGFAVFGLPTFGYLVGFILASVALGWLAERQWDRKVLKAVVSFLIAEVIIYAVGLPWLGSYLAQAGDPNAVADAFAFGLTPFIIGDVVKAVAAGALLPLTWKLVNRKQS